MKPPLGGQLNSPAGLAFDAGGNLFIADSGIIACA